MSESIAHDFPFDPRYGHDEAALRTLEAPDTSPTDFADFWQNIHCEAMAVPLNLHVEKRNCPWPGLILEK